MSQTNEAPLVVDNAEKVARMPAPRPASQPTPLAGALKKVTKNGVLLVVVFWFTAAWLYGVCAFTENHVHQLEVTVCDFDGGPIGSAVLEAVRAVNGLKTSPTFRIVDPSTTSPGELAHETFAGKTWGTIYVVDGASAAFNAAIASDDAATAYDPTAAIYYAGSQVRYYTTWASFLQPALKGIASSAAQSFSSGTVMPLITRTNTSTPWTASQAQVLTLPFSATFLDLAPFAMGVRVVLNTVGFVFPVLFQFFFLLGLNGILTMAGVYQTATFTTHVKYRLPAGALWTLVTGLSTVAWSLMYDETYNIKAKNFFALWAVSWTNGMILFDFLDIILTFIPIPFAPPIVVSLIILSVSSTVYPIDILNRFYRIHYAFPPHATWETMITIWGNGAANKLYYNLPILAGWLLLGKVGVLLCLRRRGRLARPSPARRASSSSSTDTRV